MLNVSMLSQLIGPIQGYALNTCTSKGEESNLMNWLNVDPTRFIIRQFDSSLTLIKHILFSIF